mgnify:CR=1 FL=1
MAETTAKKQNRVVKFLREVKSELKKAVWPSRKQIINNTLIVIASVIVIGIVIWAFDAIFQYGIFRFIKK